MRAARAAPDLAGVAAALAPVLQGWEEFLWLDPADPGLDLDTRLCATECARVVADLDERLRPPGVERLRALQLAADFTPTTSPYLRVERARIEADLIEELNRLGRLDRGLARLERVRADFADVPQVLVEMLLMEANVHQLLGAHAAALASAREAHARLDRLAPEQVPAGFVRVYALVVESLLLIDIGLLDRAAPLVQAAFDQLEGQEDRSGETLAMTAASELAFARGDYGWFEDVLAPRLEAGGVAGDSPEGHLERLVMVASARGRLALSEGRGLEQARDAIEAAIAELGPRADVALRPELVLCDLELALGDHASAARHAAGIEATLAARGPSAPLLMRSALAVVQGRLALLEAGRAEGLRAALQTVEGTYDDLLAAWDSVPPREGGVGFLLFGDRRALLVTLARLHVALHGPEQGALLSLPQLLRAEARGTLADLLDARATTLERVAGELLPERGGFLVYVPSYVGSVVLALDRRGARAWELVGTDTWKPLHERLSLVLRTEQALAGTRGDLLRRAEDLRDALLPVELDERISDWEELTLVGAENLGWVPFEVLPLRGRAGRPIGLEQAVSYLPSLTVGIGLLERREARLARPAPTAPRILLAVGRTAPGQPDIPWGPADAERLGGHWPAGSLEVVSDPAAARRAVLDSGARSSALLEIIAHGVRDDSRELGQGFQFDAAHALFPADLDGASCPPIAVLAVCGAGRGWLRAGDDGVSHLGGALLGIGADCVLLSRQDLSYAASLALLEVFNREVSLGVPPARALLAARREVAARPGWEHPAYHSLLHVVGLGDAPLPAPSLAERGALAAAGVSPWMVAGLVGALGLLAVALATRRRRA